MNMLNSTEVDTTISWEVEPTGVAWLTLGRPEAGNAIAPPQRNRIIELMTVAANDPAIRCVVITGSGTRHFSTGGDLRHPDAVQKEGDPPRTVGWVRQLIASGVQRMTAAVLDCPKPVIAAVNGTAAGAGASLAYACDLRVASSNAKFLMAFANVGLSTDSGASWTLPRLIGYGRAMEMLLLAEPVAAEEALRIGMVNRVVGEGEARDAAMELATRMAAGPTFAYARIKETALAAAAEGLAETLAVEAGAQAEAGATADHREAVDAFVNKRTPDFTGR